MKNNGNLNNGFTLIELILAIALASIVVIATYSLSVANNKLYKSTSDEFDMQSQVRYATEIINQNIRYSTVAFAVLDEHYNGGEGDLTERWNYLGVSKDRKEIVHYTWDNLKKRHVKNVLISAKDDFYYELYFHQKPEHENERIVDYNLLVTKINKKSDGDKEVKVTEIKTEVEALNAIQIVDRGMYNTEKAVALAYRIDPTPKAESRKAVVTMVLDTSGSMDDTMAVDGYYNKWAEFYGSFVNLYKNDKGISPKAGEGTNEGGKITTSGWIHYDKNLWGNWKLYDGDGSGWFSGPKPNRAKIVPQNSKMDMLKVQAQFLIEQLKTNKIEGDMKIIPFATNAKYTTVWKDIQRENESLGAEISSLTANGGTNTGDGLRIAYHSINNKNKTEARRNYMIVLVDGVTTQYSTISSSDPNFCIGTSTTPYVLGLGNKLDPKGEKYVLEIGKAIQGQGSNKNHNITTFIIGFSDKWENNKYTELESLNTIAKACGIGEEHHFDIYNRNKPLRDNPKYVFWAKDESSLQNVFDSISKYIEADFWQVSGPDNK